MPFPSEVATQQVTDVKNEGPRSKNLTDIFEMWNRKLHYYSGLYLLLFIWLFSFTGLVLNHPYWGIHDFWSKRKESTFKQTFQPLPEGTDLERARDLMRQLNFRGEIQWTNPNPQPGYLDFRALKAGMWTDIQADLLKKEATLHEIRVNKWGMIQMLHTLTGVNRDNPNVQRNWLVTKIWSLCMDAVAFGLILMLLSSYYMWYCLKKNRLPGWITLAAGFLLCAFFVLGLAWLYPTK